MEIILLSLVLAALLFLILRKSGNKTVLDAITKTQETLERRLGEELLDSRKEASDIAKAGREEMANHLKSFSDSLIKQMVEIAKLQSDTISKLTQGNEARLEKMRETVEKKLEALQEDNAKKLEEMRKTVDEKLHATLEKRLGESFKMVSERLELVHKGLGEMQSLASGVGDLKKVLTNVKTRGVLGEIQLANILTQILTPEQYRKNVITKKGGSEPVEYAIRLPGKDDRSIVWLPIDSKFPVEDYQRLLEARELGDLSTIEQAAKSLEATIKGEAKKIKEKYLDPPHTTDFGIMFLAYEGLYAEVLSRPGLFESLQREYSVTVSGPSTLSAFLNSLQVGFRTIAIEKRSSEVWTLLGAVKTEFGRFGDILAKTHKKLEEATNTIETAAKKSRTIERKLKNVQQLPQKEQARLLLTGDENE